MVNRNPQRPVRVGQLERVLQRFNEEQGSKTARLIAEFFMVAIEPRLKELEMRWYQHLWRFVGWVWKFLRLDRLYWWVVRGLRLDRLWRWAIDGLRRLVVRLKLHRAWRKIRRLPPEETLPYKIDDEVRTTEKGVALFEGEPKEGVVTKVTKDRVWVRCPGMTVPQEFSASVWEVVGKEEPSSPLSGDEGER